MLKKILLMLARNLETDEAWLYSHFKATFKSDGSTGDSAEIFSAYTINNGVESGTPFTLIGGKSPLYYQTATQAIALFSSSVLSPFIMTFPLASEETGVCSIVNITNGKTLFGIFRLNSEFNLPMGEFYFETFAEAFDYLNSGSTEPPTTDVGLLVPEEGEFEFKVYLGLPTGENVISVSV